MMEIARHPPPVQRTYTAPVNPTAAAAAFNNSATGPPRSNMMAGSTHPNFNPNPLVQSQGHTSSNYSIQSQPSSRSSDTTQGTAHSTLFPPPATSSHFAGAMAASPGGGASDITATDNIMNSVADANTSLFQICINLRQRLHGVPGFSETLSEEEHDADDDTDPVTLLWRTFRRGFPLLQLYNALQPAQPLQVSQDMKEEKRGKASTFMFLRACITDLKFPQEQCFIIADLYGDDTTGFVKVARVVNRVLDILVQRGIIEDVRLTAAEFERAEKGMKRTQRQHIVSELVTTERTYVQHLELLQAFKRLVEEKGIIHGDAIHHIFFNLNSLLDFQRRFLIRVEQTNALPEEEQNWGKLFVLYCEAFRVYEPYISNQKKCEKTVVAEFPKLREAGGGVEMRQMVESSTSLYGFLMKPFQRLSKYPLLLDDLYKKGDLDDDRKQDLITGKEAATNVLARTNMAVDREEKAAAVQELKTRVEDWKGHRVEGFGDLLLYGSFTVVKSENVGPGKDGERQVSIVGIEGEKVSLTFCEQYHVYLFETILLCCKDIDLSKPKNKLSNRQLVDKRGKPKLQLKGRIFMQNVTDLISLSKPGSYTCQIFWKGDPGIENFIIRFTTEEMMKKWMAQIEAQRRRYTEERHRSSDASGRMGTSATEFEFMRNQTNIENPYARMSTEDDEDDDLDDLGGSYLPRRDFSQSRIGSQSSLRSQSTEITPLGPTSAPSQMRASTSRFPPVGAQGQGISLRTKELPQIAQSPNARQVQESYFSPTEESPLSSSRTSTSSAHMYPFPRQQLPQNGYYEEGHGSTRFTAPAMPGQRQASSSSSESYRPSSRTPGRAANMHSAQQMPTAFRNRSASSPDIHNNGQRPQQASARNQPPVPEVPVPYQQSPHMIPRSQSNSPNLPNGVPRNPNLSPQAQRERERAYPQSQQRPPQMNISNGYGSAYNTPRSDPQGGQSASSGPRVMSRTDAALPPIPSSSSAASRPTSPTSGGASLAPAPLKVKVHCPSAGQTLTLVVPLDISYALLRDRIDAKLQRSTNLSLSDRVPKECQVKLKFLDEEDYASIQSDEDVQTAFEVWAEQRGETVAAMGEIELYCQR